MIRINTQPRESGQSASFEAEARRTASTLRAALAELFRAVEADATRPQEVSRKFGLNKNLTWKLSKILAEDSPEVVARHLPGRPGLAIFLRTMERASAPPDELATFASALTEYERFVHSHAADRAQFAVMLAASNGGEAQREEDSRKLSFQGNCALWGVQARLKLSVHIVLPSTGSELLDLVVVSGFVGFHRLRADVAWPLAVVRTRSDSGAPLAAARVRPLDPTVGPSDPPIMRAFSAGPAQQLRAVPTSANGYRYEIGEGPIGRGNAVTCIVGRVSHAIVSPWRSEADHWGEHFISLSTPAEVLIHDLFVHRDLPLAREPLSAPPTAHLYSQLPNANAYPAAPRDRGLLPMSDPVLQLGSLSEPEPNIEVPEFPRYRELMETACTAAGCSLGDLLGYRLRLRYPPMPALAVLRYPLAERPA